jgi:hypothetical protein
MENKGTLSLRKLNINALWMSVGVAVSYATVISFNKKAHLLERLREWSGPG